MTLIIILSIVFYYILGFFSLIYIFDEINEDCIFIGLWFFGLSIISIGFAIYSIREKNKNFQKVKVKTSINNNNGIIKTKNYLAYNFPDENYMGVIEIDVREIDCKYMDKIINDLNKWAENEIKKIAKIRALEEISKNSM